MARVGGKAAGHSHPSRTVWPWRRAIHLQACPVDGYHPETNTVFQYHGCLWHGCRQCYPTPDERKEVIRMDRGKAITRKVAYGLTLQRAKHLRDAGYTVVEKWEHEAPAPWVNTCCLEKQTETYPHAIVYDFESYQDKTKAACPTRDLSYRKRARTHLRIHCGHTKPRA